LRAARREAHGSLDHLARARGVGGVVDPYLRQRGVDRELAREARGVGVEDARAYPAVREEVHQQVGLGRLRPRGRLDALSELDRQHPGEAVFLDARAAIDLVVGHERPTFA
jgi:hypothetical protein